MSASITEPTTSNIDPRPTFQALFDDLRASRALYEHLRRRNASLSQRVDLIEHLHELRADLAVARQGAGLL